MFAINRILVCSVAFVFAISVWAVTPPVQATDLSGAAFSDATMIQPMEDAWLKQAIAYQPEDSGADLTVTLNQQFLEFMLPHVEQYGREHNLKIHVNRGTCGISAGQLSKKQIDIGAFCCPPALSDRLPGLKFHTVGIHPIPILLHPDNPITNLTLEQVRKIFQGDIHRWSELGGKDLPIQVVIRLHCKNRPGHWRLLLDDADSFSPGAQSVGAIEDVFSLIGTNPNAIGFEVMWLSDEYRRAGKVKTISIDGIPPNQQTSLLNGSYPLYRVLSITTWEGDGLGTAHSRDLAAFITEKVDRYGPVQGIIPTSQLRQAGWKFQGDELIGAPE